MGRIEASIMGESALIDRETGRVFWEGGASLTLYESLVPKFEPYGLEHAVGALLTTVLILGFVSVLVGWLKPSLKGSDPRSIFTMILWTMLEWSPRVENRLFLAVVVICYVLESYHCPTRRFLTNAISSPLELEEYLHNLIVEQPTVSWTVKSFHYERRISPYALIRLFRRLVPPNESTATSKVITPPVNPIFPLTKKVMTHQAVASYRYRSCKDSTMAGVWQRALADGAPPFTKIAITKLLVLTDRKSREDYFRQQSEFVSSHGQGDEFVEFSTDIQVSGYRPRMLAVHPVKGIHSAKLFRLHLFWLFTLLGLSIPYRIWFARHCDCLRVTVVKETSANSVVNASSRSWFGSHGSVPELPASRVPGDKDNSNPS